MTPSPAVRLAAGLALAASLALGCSGPPAEPAARVTGTVTLDGRPPGGGPWKIDFVSAAATVSAPVGRDGTFQVPAMPAGRYKVAVGAPPSRGAPSKAAAVLHKGDNTHENDAKATGGAGVPKRYADAATSGLEVDVAPGGPPLDIKLTGK